MLQKVKQVEVLSGGLVSPPVWAKMVMWGKKNHMKTRLVKTSFKITVRTEFELEFLGIVKNYYGYYDYYAWWFVFWFL
jgi:hypothetical protein